MFAQILHHLKGTPKVESTVTLFLYLYDKFDKLLLITKQL